MSIFDSIRRLFGGSPGGDGPSDGAGSSNGSGSFGPEGDEVGAAGSGGDDEMIPCEEALRLVHEYLDGELDDVPRSRVKRHFDVCGRCYPHLRLESSYREAVRRAAAGERAPAELKAKVSRLLAEARSEE